MPGDDEKDSVARIRALEEELRTLRLERESGVWGSAAQTVA